MNQDYWLRQQPDKPLFEDMIWSRPENRSYAGKLLIIGGNAHGFAAVADAYQYSEKAGAGTVRVVMPDALQKNVSRLFPEAEFAPSTPSGSFAQTALGEFLPMAHWADGVLVAGDIGRNSETAIALESFLQKHGGAVTLTKDGIEYITSNPQLIANRENTLLVLSFSQLQKLAVALKFTTAFTLNMDLLRAVDALQAFTETYSIHIVTRHLHTILVAAGGRVSSTSCDPDERTWRVKIASGCAVWWMQNPSKPFEALTTSLVTR